MLEGGYQCTQRINSDMQDRKKKSPGVSRITGCLIEVIMIESVSSPPKHDPISSMYLAMTRICGS